MKAGEGACHVWWAIEVKAGEGRDMVVICVGEETWLCVCVCLRMSVSVLGN